MIEKAACVANERYLILPHLWAFHYKQKGVYRPNKNCSVYNWIYGISVLIFLVA